MSDADLVEHFERLGFAVDIDALTFTTESVEDFLLACQQLWHRAGNIERYEAGGILILRSAQPKANQPERDIAVVSLGHARVLVGVLPTVVVDPLYPRYANTMG